MSQDQPRIEQWPLSAAATLLLFHVSPSDARKGSDSLPGPGPTKVAIKELLLRGAFDVEIKPRKLRKHEITLSPPSRHVRLPEALHRLEGLIGPHVPGKLQKVLAKTRKGKLNPMAVVVNDAFAELERYGLGEELTERGLVRSKQRRRLTRAGDEWKLDAERRLEELRDLVRRSDDALQGDAELLAAHGAIIILVNDGLGAIAKLDPRRRSGSDLVNAGHPLGYPAAVPYVGGGAEAGPVAFDAFAGVGDLIASSVDAGIAGSFDAGVGSGLDSSLAGLDSAFDSISTSIDSAVSSSFDGGGGGGADGGGGGGDGGGGGGGN